MVMVNLAWVHGWRHQQQGTGRETTASLIGPFRTLITTPPFSQYRRYNYLPVLSWSFCFLWPNAWLSNHDKTGFSNHRFDWVCGRGCCESCAVSCEEWRRREPRRMETSRTTQSGEAGWTTKIGGAINRRDRRKLTDFSILTFYPYFFNFLPTHWYCNTVLVLVRIVHVCFLFFELCLISAIILLNILSFFLYHLFAKLKL
jgi:hypothetical protein